MSADPTPDSTPTPADTPWTTATPQAAVEHALAAAHAPQLGEVEPLAARVGIGLGVLQLAAVQADVSAAESAYRTALHIATEQKAHSLELRAALDLCDLLAEWGRGDDAARPSVDRSREGGCCALSRSA